MDEGLRKDRYEKRQVKTREPDRSHLSASPMGEDNHHQGDLAHGRGRPAPRSPRPWARMIRARFTLPWGEDNPIPANLTHFDSHVLRIVVISDFWIIYLSFRLDQSYSRSFTTKIVEKPEVLKTAREDLNVSRGQSTIIRDPSTMGVMTVYPNSRK
ncbi:hypothetical protein F2Q70_00044785 [Brassica cretica]|uniref:Uncharacterized protein n=1 Tax=Brassica cretica TaxID=69181 RepID=A0A8S9KNV4_BRACR|nr:hypothetical protein F2Q70_00044785 [Brassica cretica]KAF2608024.1 hypothetical protein F2Q68_00045754 [Brassica cretica]